MEQGLVVVLVAACALLLVVLLGVLVGVLAGSRRTQARLEASQADLEALREQVEALGARAPEPASTSHESRHRAPEEYLITTLPSGATGRHVAQRDEAEAPVRQLTAGEFASVALGESLVKVFSFGYGVRRALSAENRNRIRFEVRREVKRARKQRRRDVKEAKRHLRSTQRDITEDAA
jgi:type II secretory pathway pseudopilin PulG